MRIRLHEGKWVGDVETDILVVRKPDGVYTYPARKGNVQIVVKATAVVSVRQMGNEVHEVEFVDTYRDFAIVRASHEGIPI